jgi:hypothetical protein
VNTLPAIGTARGVFDIFVPGLFLVTNAVLAIYLFPFTDAGTRSSIAAVGSSPILGAVIAVCFGYLVGVLLRLYRCEYADRWSAWWIRKFNRAARLDSGGYRRFASEDFPYVEWMQEVCRTSLPTETARFFDATWARRIGKPRNRQYFNFCKAIVASHDAQAGADLFAAEAMSRYISSMLYALVAAFAFMLIDSIALLFAAGPFILIVPLMASAYGYSILVILARYRFMRIKEVELLFAACYRHRAVFEEADGLGATVTV